MANPLFIIGLVLSAASIAYNVAQARRLRKEARRRADEAAGIEVRATASARPVPVAVGYCAAPGQLVYAQTAARLPMSPSTIDPDTMAPTLAFGTLQAYPQDLKFREFLMAQYVLCAAGVQGLVDLYVDDVPWNSGLPGGQGEDTVMWPPAVSMAHTFLQGAAGAEATAFTDERDATSRGAGFAHLDSFYKYEVRNPVFFDIPRVLGFLQGQQCRLLGRTGQTAQFRPRAFTTDSPLVLLEYMTDATWGIGRPDAEFDLGAWYDAFGVGANLQWSPRDLWATAFPADLNALDGTSHATWGAYFQSLGFRDIDDTGLDAWHTTAVRYMGRYETNGLLRRPGDKLETILAILATMPGAMLFRSLEGKWKLAAPPTAVNTGQTAAQASRGTIDAHMIHEPPSKAWPNTSERLNSLTIKFNNLLKDFAADSVTWPPAGSTAETTLKNEDGGLVLADEFELELAATPYHAMDIAHEMVMTSRRPRYVVRGRPLLAIYEPGDVVKLDAPQYGFEGEYIRLSAATLTPERNGRLRGEVQGIQYVPSDYAVVFSPRAQLSLVPQQDFDAPYIERVDAAIEDATVRQLVVTWEVQGGATAVGLDYVVEYAEFSELPTSETPRQWRSIGVVPEGQAKRVAQTITEGQRWYIARVTARTVNLVYGEPRESAVVRADGVVISGTGIETCYALSGSADPPAANQLASNDWTHRLSGSYGTRAGLEWFGRESIPSPTTVLRYRWAQDRVFPATTAVGGAVASPWRPPYLDANLGVGDDGENGAPGVSLEPAYALFATSPTPPTTQRPNNSWPHRLAGTYGSAGGIVWTAEPTVPTEARPHRFRSQRRYPATASIGDAVEDEWSVPVREYSLDALARRPQTEFFALDLTEAECAALKELTDNAAITGSIRAKAVAAALSDPVNGDIVRFIHNGQGCGTGVYNAGADTWIKMGRWIAAENVYAVDLTALRLDVVDANIRGIIRVNHLDADVRNARILWAATPFFITSSSAGNLLTLTDEVATYDTLLCTVLVAAGGNRSHFAVVSVPVAQMQSSFAAYDDQPIAEPGNPSEDLYFSTQVGSAAGEGAQLRLWKVSSNAKQIRIYGRTGESAVLYQILGFKNPFDSGGGSGGGGTGSDDVSIDSFTADSISIRTGQSTTLRWQTSNATGVSLNQGIGTVDADGSRTVSPTSDTTYTLTAMGPGGPVAQQVTVEVTAQLPVAVAPAFSIASITSVGEGTSIAIASGIAGGTYDSLEYAWSVDGAGNGSIVGNGARATYTAPSVTADKSVTVRCTVTARGTGTNARTGTSDSRTATEAFTVTNSLDPPGRPSTPTVVSRTATTSLVVRTTAGSGGAPTLYRWRYSTNSTISSQDPEVTSSGPQVTITGLQPGTDYWIDVRAENAAGVSSYSGNLATSTSSGARTATIQLGDTSILRGSTSAALQDRTAIPSGFGTGEIEGILLYSDGDYAILNHNGVLGSGVTVSFVWLDAGGTRLTSAAFNAIGQRINANSSAVRNFFSQLVNGEASSAVIAFGIL